MQPVKYMNFLARKKARSLLLPVLLVSFLSLPLQAYAEVDYNAEAEARKSLPVATNEIENWPEGPLLGTESAILIDANSGTILYEKNIHEKLYPASTTKLLTCLIAAEKCKMDETVDFSTEAVFSIESDSSNMGMDVGQQITMEQALYGILVGSANEVANAVAEHISGTIPDFIDLMNKKATELGCKDSHFVTTNGLFDENHYTTAYDLSLIAREFFKHELLCKMSSTSHYNIPISPTQPDDIWLNSKNQLYEGQENSYEFLVGSKTGYTTEARQTLVSCAEKDGMRLICVILKEESPAQFTDTVALFDYGFSNFKAIKVADMDTPYNIDDSNFFTTNSDIFGTSKSLLSINPDDYIVLPNTLTYDDLQSSLSYDTVSGNQVAKIQFTYQGISLGYASIDLATDSPTSFDFGSEPVTVEDSTETADSKNVIYINIKKVLFIIIAIASIAIIFFVVRAVLNNYQFYRRRNNRLRKKRKKYKRSDYDNYRY